MAEKHDLILIKDDRLWRSVLSDTYSTATLVGVIGIGLIVESPAMQWAGFVIFMLWVLVRASAKAKMTRKTAQEAADYIRDKLGVVATPPASGGAE